MDTRIIEKMNKDSLFIIGSYYTSTPQSYTFSLSFPSNVADIFYLIVPPSKHHQRGDYKGIIYLVIPPFLSIT